MINILTVLLVIITIILIGAILIQPDKSQTTAKTLSSLEVEKDGLEKFTEVLSVLFIVVALLIMILSMLKS